jgi:hypothetical protein
MNAKSHFRYFADADYCKVVSPTQKETFYLLIFWIIFTVSTNFIRGSHIHIIYIYSILYKFFFGRRVFSEGISTFRFKFHVNLGLYMTCKNEYWIFRKLLMSCKFPRNIFNGFVDVTWGQTNIASPSCVHFTRFLQGTHNKTIKIFHLLILFCYDVLSERKMQPKFFP